MGFDGSTYVHDAQNRLVSATKDGVTMLFEYDGINRQVSRRIGTTGSRTFSVWDGWDLIEEYQSGNNVTARYLSGPNGLVKNLTNCNSYFQDGSGSTSYLTDDSGQLLERYRYDLQGTPSFFDGHGSALSASALDVRNLFTGQQWYQEVGLYDLRNRFYSPDIGRFLQADPTGFAGDATNLYRYCVNNPVTFFDPTGLNLTITLYPAHWRGWHYDHVGIGVNTTITESYYPSNGKFKGPGEIILDIGYPYKITSITIRTNEKEDEAVLAYIAKVNAHLGTYTLWNNNCTRFVEGALRAAGFRNISTTRQPTVLMSDLQNRSSGREIRRRMEGSSPTTENRVGPFGIGPFGSPFGSGGPGPVGEIGPIDSGPLNSPPDSGPGTGPASEPYVPGPIEPYWQDPNDVPEFDPFPESPYGPNDDSDIGSGLKND
jgi:RHS repeat-associated protein